MQPLITAARASLTEALVIDLIRDNPAISIGAGCEVLDRDLNVLSDISDDLQSGEVSRSNFATLHGSCSVELTTQLAWGSAILRPYMLITNGVDTARFNLGAYFTSTPDHTTGIAPTVYSVQGYDILDALNVSVGDSYALNAGTDYLQAVENILINQGYSKYTIDPARTGTVLPNARGWAMQDNITWLGIVNDLLSSVGYRGIFSDWDGQLVCAPYVEPSEREPEWTYDDGQYSSQLGPQQVVKHDFYSAPNKWIFVRSNDIEGESPSEGAGIYIYQNDFDGETSVEARGRVIATRYDFEAADQDALVAQGLAQVARDKQIDTAISAETTPNPLHWHFDVVTVDTAELGIVTVQESAWKLPLGNGMMSHEWTVV